MNTSFNTKMLIEVAVLNGIIILLTIAGFFIPSIMGVTIIFSAAMVAVLTVRTSRKISLYCLPILYIAAFLVTGQPIGAGVMVFSFYLPGMVMGYGLEEKWDYRTILVGASAAYLFPVLVIIVVYNWVEHVNQIDKFILQPLQQFLDESKQGMQDVFKMYKDLGITIDENTALATMNKVFEMIKNMVSILIPGFFIISAAGFSFITLAVSRFILKRKGYHYDYLPLFYELRVSKGMVAAFGISLVLSISVDNNVISAALVNITFILFMVMSLCGVSVLDYFIHRAGVPGVFRIIIYMVLVVILTIMSMAMPLLHPIYFFAVLSLGDSIFDFRRLKNKGEHYEQ